MKVLVVGSGGREHALVWKLSQSPRVTTIFCAPGNAGISRLAECIDIKPTDIERLTSYVRYRDIDLTVVGPEAPLVAGIVDRFRAAGLKIFGPTQASARLEGSKVFAKEFLSRHKIPTADFKVFENYAAALGALEDQPFPLVLKVDGLASGKGVVVAGDRTTAEDFLREVFVEKKFGEAGNRIVIEECLQGTEASFIVFADGQHALPLAASQDHKQAYDSDQGPNTGGMGAYAPAPVVTPKLHSQIMHEIIYPTLTGMAAAGHPYTGILYAGLMLTSKGPKVLEYNCRFGDPECQPLLFRMTGDLVEVIEAVLAGSLDQVELAEDPMTALCVVLAAQGYPGQYAMGQRIEGLDGVAALEDVFVFHAGTRWGKNSEVQVAGGRVLGVTARGKNLAGARELAYQAAQKISWEGMFYRRDIGKRGL